MNIQEIRVELKQLADPQKAQFLQGFFKTGPGQYGEGDRFLGIRVPMLRKLARKYRDTPIPEVKKLLVSPLHEERLLALFLLIHAYNRQDDAGRKGIYSTYLQNTSVINNWDLVDASAEHIVGRYLRERSKGPLYRLARSRVLWERRIAIMATFHYIKHSEFNETLKIADLLLEDPEDLIHKAVGWMLREAGKRHQKTAEDFLKDRYRDMPRTMLRYAIERFPNSKRERYLKGRA